MATRAIAFWLSTFHFPAPDAPEPRMSEATSMINRGEIMEEKGVVRARAVAIGAQSIGALATGAIALGAFALGAVAIGCLVIGRAKIGRLEIGELVVGRLTVTEPPNTP
jgi:hypothetical protein